MAKIIIRKRGSSYQYRFEIAPVDGVRKWLYKSGFKTKKEAETAGAEALAEYINAGSPIKPCNMSYSDFLDYWMDAYCRNNMAYNTTSTYETLIRLYIKPELGKYRLADINCVTLTKFTNKLVDEHDFSRDYYRNIIKVIKSSFSYAIEYGHLKYDPSSKTKLPIKKNYKSPRKKHVYSQDDIDAILEKFKKNKEFICAFLTACYTGMRTGEVFALTWDDIDFDKNIISVEHSVYDKKKDSLGRWYMGPTKTKTGKRTIPLCDTLKEALLNYKKYQDLTKQLYANDYKKYGLKDIIIIDDVTTGRIVDSKYGEQDLDFVFTKEDGTYSGTDIIKDPVKIIKNELNINCRFYDLRGSFATHADHNGVVTKDIAAILGHASVETTDEFYLSPMDESVVKAVNSINNLISSDTISKTIKFEI